MLQKRSFLVGSVLAGVEEEVEVEVSTSICKVWGGGGLVSGLLPATIVKALLHVSRSKATGNDQVWYLPWELYFGRALSQRMPYSKNELIPGCM